jgi:hypothetical protein
VSEKKNNNRMGKNVMPWENFRNCGIILDTVGKY